jgi:hypothetical protein
MSRTYGLDQLHCSSSERMGLQHLLRQLFAQWISLGSKDWELGACTLSCGALTDDILQTAARGLCALREASEL